MPATIKDVKAGDSLSAKAWNEIVKYLNQLLRIRTDGTIRVMQNAAGIQLSAVLPPSPIYFKLTQDTPANQGYVTAKPLIWLQEDDKYDVVEAANEIKIYDRISATSYDNTSNQGPSNWTKKNFIGRASWTGDRGQWQIEEMQHVARIINFKFNSVFSSAVSATATCLEAIDGLNPETSGQPINIVQSPDAGYTGNTGDKGTAFWRNDLDNSVQWQYQVFDKAC